SLLLPGQRRPIDIDAELRGWPAIHVRLALLEAREGPPSSRRLERSGALYWVSAGRGSLPPGVKRAAGSYFITPEPVNGRAAAFTAAGGIGLVLTASPRLPLPAARAARVAIVLGIAVVALLATGLPAHYLRPHRWGSFGNHLNHGLLIAQAAMYPYKGGDPWTRLTLLLNGVAFLVPATALAFWPVKRHARE